MTLGSGSLRRRALALCAAGAVGLGIVAFAAPANAAASASQPARPVAAPTATGPEAPDFPAAFGYSQFVNPEANPPGANDFSCRPSTAHPRPVVLVHGTFENRYDNFARLSPSLARAGYCVFALNYGESANVVGFDPAVKATGDIRTSAKQLAAFVDRVLAATGSRQVDIVGHSQGGLMPRQYLKFEGGADPANPAKNKVRNLITLGATHHGTTVDGIGTLAGTLGLLPYSPILLGEAARQQVVGSDFLRTLNSGGDTVPGVNYLVIATRYDEVSTPYQATFLTAGPGATVRNVTLQDGCEIDLSDHLSMSYSRRAIGYVLQGLDPNAGPPPCLPNAPVV